MVLNLPWDTVGVEVEAVAVNGGSQASQHRVLVDMVLVDYHLLMDQSPESFAPRSALDTAEISGCQGAAVTHCHPRYRAWLIPEQVDVPPQWTTHFQVAGRLKFEFGDRSEHPGVATNWGYQTGPDYTIDRAKQTDPNLAPQGSTGKVDALTTTADVREATLVVTSEDYGGVGFLYASMTIDGLAEDIWAKVGDDGEALLPLDTNGNGIADGWEKSVNGGQLITDVNEDKEPPQGTWLAFTGDGLSVHDEYRGFHYLERVVSDFEVRWTRTDPVGTRDVFYYTKEPAFDQGVRDILAQQPVGITYRRVGPRQAVGSRNASVHKEFNRNRVPAEREKAYALKLIDHSISGALGDAKANGPWPPANNGYPIWINNGGIEQTASQYGPMPVDVLRAYVIAHEVGHKFRRFHPLRTQPSLCCDMVPPPSPVRNLQLNQYAITSSGEILIRLRSYVADGKKVWADGLVIGDPLTAAPADFTITEQDHNDNEVTDGVFKHRVYKLKLKSRLSQSSPPPVRVKNQERKIMDWVPHLLLESFQDWAFSESDAEKLCVLFGACGP